jgi:hypothetical protein
VNTIDALLAGVSTDAPVAHVLVGAFWTAAVLDTDFPCCGIASTMHCGHYGHHMADPPVAQAGDLLARSGLAAGKHADLLER